MPSGGDLSNGNAAEGGSTMRFVDVGDALLALESHGCGSRPLLFLHGWISSRRIWTETIARLDLTEVTAHALDWRGCGASDRTMDGHDLAGYARDLCSVLERFELPPTVVAHSMGAKVALYAALASPGAVRNLLLAAPGSPAGIPPSEQHRRLTLEAFGNRRRIERFLRAATAQAPAPRVFAGMVEDALVAQREAWFGWYDHGRGVDFSGRLGALACEVTVVLGRRDGLASPARLRADLIDRLPSRPRVIELPNVAHTIPLEAPDELAAAIREIAERKV